MTTEKVKQESYYRASVAIRKDREPDLKAALGKLGLATVGELVQLIMQPGAAESLVPSAKQMQEQVATEAALAPKRKQALRALRSMSAADLLKMVGPTGVGA